MQVQTDYDLSVMAMAFAFIVQIEHLYFGHGHTIAQEMLAYCKRVMIDRKVPIEVPDGEVTFTEEGAVIEDSIWKDNIIEGDL